MAADGEPALRERLARQGFAPAPLLPEDLERHFRLQYARFVAAARRSGLRLER